MSAKTRAGHQALKAGVDSSILRDLLASREISRRDFLKATGVLVVGFSMFGPTQWSPAAAAQPPLLARPADWLDSWLAISQDGSVTLFTGKVDLGTGVETAMAQIAAEELDVAFARIRVVQGDTALTVNQGPTVGSTSIAVGGAQIRQAAAEARHALLDLAAERLAVETDQLVVRDGVVSGQGDASNSVSYGDLIGGGQFNLTVGGAARPKSRDEYTIVGQSIRRVDIPAKVTGQAEYVQDVRLPGMLHGRVLRPTGIGSMLLSIDESSVSNLPGLVKVVHRGNFVGVIAEREEQAIRAAQQLRLTWSEWSGLPAMEDLYEVLRNTPSTERVLRSEGDVDAALAGAARTLAASYYFPFQGHASIGPSCAVADVRDGRATIWSGTQVSHLLQLSLARVLDLPVQNVRVIWTQGAGSYGTNGADDATLDAALLSQTVGRPVRIQWMRDDEHRWATAGPAMVMDLRGGLDAHGAVAAWDYQISTPNHYYTDLLAEQLIASDPVVHGGLPTFSPALWGGDRGMPPYLFGNRREVVHQLQESPLRSAPLRAPGQIATSFAQESFIDELAADAGADPVEFRLRHLVNARPIAVLQAAAARAGWDTRRSPKADAPGSRLATGRGIAVVERNAGPHSTFVAMVAEVEVDRETGRVLLKRAVVAHDCGLIINPDGVVNQVEGNVLQTASRTLKEEATFDRSNVTSVDWVSYPILTFPEVPEVEVVLIDRPDLPASGVGEPASCPVPGAIANAIFDATGARLRQVPFTPERVKAALSERS